MFKIIGGLPGGTVSAMAMSAVGLSAEADGTVFIGTKVGVYRSTLFHAGASQDWQRMENAPLGILSLTVSPHFEADQTVIAGTSNGIYLSRDAGENWHAAHVPIAGAMVLALCCSPNYANDGMLVAGTLEDGIWVSEDCGERWHGRSFGLLDAAAFALAFSPNFAKDETVFAGTDTAIYYSYNGARAWKPLGFPESAAPILSLAVSPEFEHDGTVFAGTERNGLYRSTDAGVQWQPVNLAAASINTLATSATHGLLAATETGVWQSQDGGASWTPRINIADAISLAVSNDTALTGTVDDGAWMLAEGKAARKMPTPPMRSVSGLALSPSFEQDRTAFIFGLQEGIWRTCDGGTTWVNINASLPGLNVHALVVSPAFTRNRMLFAASDDGILVSTDAGDHWATRTPQAAKLVAISPNGQWLAAAGADAGLRISSDDGHTWRSVVGPWDAGGTVAALAITDAQVLYVALIEGVDSHLGLWHCTADQCVNVLNLPLHDNPVVSLWSVDAQVWCASFGNRVWTFNTQSGAVAESAFEDSMDEIIALTGEHHLDVNTLYACTRKNLYVSTHGGDWQLVHTFGRDQAIAFAISASSSYALFLGGAFATST